MYTQNAIAINHLTVLYGAQPALVDINCIIPSGVICALIGPNGAGKSTLLKTLMGIVKPFAGTIQIFGKSIHKASGLFAYVPQRTAIDWQFPISVYDVVMMGRYARLGFFKWPTKHDADLVMQALISVRMLEHKDALIGALSGGQQQRVFLARALVQQASLLLLDEPFTGVDTVTESICIQILQQLKSQGCTIVVVHHDLAAVSTYADWAVLVHHTLIKAGPLNTVLTASHLRHAYGTVISDIVER